MAHNFDDRSLVGRTFGSVLDEAAPGWEPWGFMDGGPPAAIAHKIAPIVAALRELTVVLLDIDGAVVPRRVWYSGRWWFYRDGRGVEWLEVLTDTGQKVAYYGPHFARPAAQGSGRTGTAGRPSSWHLVEVECRRRYNNGERHANGPIESPAAWADVLLPWLRGNHPDEPPLERKTTKNNLSQLLRKLKKAEA